jgi:hypothetical protein
MKLKRSLSALAHEIVEEAQRNPEFRVRLERALGIAEHGSEKRNAETTRKGGRRTPAVLDPVELARQGEQVLRSELSTLGLEQLRDIVAQYGMDPGKLVMKWKDPERVRGRILELALARATKGDAFRGEPDPAGKPPG